MRFFFTGVLLSLLVGCSWVGSITDISNSNNYQQAVEMSPLVVPGHLSSEAIKALYPIPQTVEMGSLPGVTDTPRPIPLTAGAQLDAVRIQRLGDESWSVVNVAPGQLWPQVRAFLVSSGIPVSAVDAKSGLIDTKWVQLEDRELLVRFRFRVDTGVQRNTSELHVIQQDKDGSAAEERWPSISSDLDLEHNMLRNVSQFIANSAESAPVSMVADRSMTGLGRITLEDDKQPMRLRLELPFNRAWAAVEKSFPDAGFRIDDKNRTQGLFYVTYVGPENETSDGWFDWLWGGERDHPLLEKAFQIKLDIDGEAAVFIELLTHDGALAAEAEQQGLLTLLKGNIT